MLSCHLFVSIYIKKFQVGIIGGSGFYDMPELSDVKIETITTPFGDPSDNPISGTIHGVPCVLLARYYIMKVVTSIIKLFSI